LIHIDTPSVSRSTRSGWIAKSVQATIKQSDLPEGWQALRDFFPRQAKKPARNFAIWALWLSGMYFLLGPASYVRIVDTGNGTLPARMWAGQALAHGQLSDWFPLACCGSDRTLNAYCLELPNVLFAVLPGWLAYGMVMYLQRFVAGYFFFRLMRDELRTGTAAAYATAFSYSLYYQPGIHFQWDGFQLYEGFGVPALPLLIWGIHRLHESKSHWRYAGAALAGIGLALSANYFQSIFFPLLVLFWVVCIRPTLDWRMLRLLTAMAIGWLAIQTPQILAAAEFAPLSHRADMVITSSSDYVRNIENVTHWPRLIANSNTLLIAVAVISGLLARFKDRRLLWTLLALGATLGFVKNYFFFTDHIFVHLGPLSGFHFHRVVLLTPFLISLAVGLGVEALTVDWRIVFTGAGRRWTYSLGGIALTIVLIHLAIVSANANSTRYTNMLLGESYQLLYRHPDIEAVAKLKDELPPFRVASVTDAWRSGLPIQDARNWTFAPGYAWAYGLETADGYLVLYSHRYKKFWSQILFGLFRHDPWCYRKHENWGNMVYLWKSIDSLPFQYLYDFGVASLADLHVSISPRWKFSDVATNLPFRYFYDLDLLSVANTRFIFSPLPLDDPRLRLLPSDVRHQLVERSVRNDYQRIAGMFRGEWSWHPMYVYENLACLPRYQFVGSVRICNGEVATLAALRETKAEQFATEAIVNLDDVAGVDLDYLGGKGEVYIISKKADDLELEVTCDARGMLVIANTFSPNWKAEIDGQPAQILPANYTFQGVVVDEGVHRVHLRYQSSASWTALFAKLTGGNRSSIR
jgi:Protein of unknown function (DUF6044)